MGSDDQPAFHTRLRLVRTERDVSRKDLAAAVGVHHQTIGYIERTEYSPSLDLALRIARHFDLPVEELFSLEPFPSVAAISRDGRRERGTDGSGAVVTSGN